MKTIIYKAEDRGHLNHGWLDTYHSFSFGNYYNPAQMHFGALRVINDDTIEGGRGFGTHPHDNMEIITIPLEGDLEHQDNMGNKAVINEGEVQVMSAGTGIFHSEYNHNADKPVKLFQIWVFPNKKNVQPRYDQISIRDLAKVNKLYQILSPNKDDEGVWIHQDAWFFLGDFEKDTSDIYSVKNGNNGVYLLVIDGEIEVDGIHLGKRDALGIWDTKDIKIQATKKARVLLMEVPMQLN